MIVFKSYLKIVKKFLPLIILYSVIFIFFAVFSVMNNNQTSTFSSVKPNVAIISKDDSDFTNSLIEYVKDNAKIIDIEEEKISDALFFREVDYILIIPENYGEEFLKGNILDIEIKKVADSYSSYYIEMLFNKYLNIAATYVSVGMPTEIITENISSDVSYDIEVTMYETVSNDKTVYYYNFANYSLLAISLFIVGLLSHAFNSKYIKYRNNVSPISIKKINFELMLGNIIITSSIWGLYVLISILLYPKSMLTLNGLLLILNSLIFSFSCLSMGFLIGNLIKNKDAQGAIVNVISLGTSFICGAFVPQAFLSEGVLNIGKFFPSYYYINCNDMITKITGFSFDNLIPIFKNMGFIAIFGVVYLIITNLVTKLRVKE